MAEIIAEPTALSKVIPLKFKINDVDVRKTTQLSTNKQFNTTDTDAWFTFELDGLAATNGTYDLTLINLDDTSIFHHVHVLFPTLPFHYKLNSSEDVTLNEIRHAGRWLGQLVVTMSNGDTTARQFGFNIAGHILDGQDAQVILLSDYQALINTINLAKDDLAQYNVDYAALLVDIAAAEDARVTAYNQLLADQQANIEAFDVALDEGIVAANLATKLHDFETTNNSRLLSAEQQLAKAATKVELNAVASGSPKGVYATLSALQSAKPTGDTNIYLVTADGKWYYWSGSAWTAGGTYQSTGIADGSVSYKKVNNSVSTKFINLESEQPLSVSGGSLVRNGSEYVYTSRHSGFFVAFYDFDEHVSDGDKVVIAFDVKSSNLALDRRVRLRIINGGIDILPSDFFIGRDYVRYFYVFDITSAIADQTTHLSLSWYTPTVGDNFCLDKVMIINTGTKYTTDEINSIDWKSVAYSSSVDVDIVLKKYMSKLESDVATIKSKSTMEFKPPAKLDFIAGEKVELFDRGLIKTDMEKEKFLIEITLPSGSPLPSPQAKMHRNLLDFSGISSLTSSNLYFWIRDIYGNQLTTSKSMLYKSVPFSVNPIPPNPATVKNILFCGDSLMSTGLITQKFKDKMAGYGLTNFNLVGRRFHTTVENRFEGLGGWAWRNYVDDPATLPISYPDNYFWDSAIGDINIKKYVDTYCGGVNLDYVVCELGMNHLVNSTNQGSDLTVVRAKAKRFIDKVHADYPSAKVILVGIHRFSDLYKYNQNKNRDFLFDLNEMYEAIAGDASYSSFVKSANVSSMFDSKYGSQFITQSAGLFAGDETEEYLIDYVHPNDKGYQMYADCIVRKFITMI